jgi:hypothetical protein
VVVVVVVVVVAVEALVWLMRKWLGMDLLLYPSFEGLLSASDGITRLCSLSCHSPCQQPLHPQDSANGLC